MYRHIFLALTVCSTYAYACVSFHAFFPHRAGILKHPWFPFAGVFFIFAFYCIYPESMYDLISFFSPLSVIAASLFFKASLSEKITAFSVVYLTLILGENLSSLLLYTLHVITLGKFEYTTFFFVNSDPLQLGLYVLFYTLSLFIICRKILLMIKAYTKMLDLKYFLRLLLPYLAVYFLSNGCMAVVHFDLLWQAVLFLAIWVAGVTLPAAYALKSLHFFIRRENERTVLLLKRSQLKEQLKHSEELSRQYQTVRKVNHDISDHLTSIAFLLDSGRSDEAEDYISRLIKYNRREDRS